MYQITVWADIKLEAKFTTQKFMLEQHI
jgi:hypothetical protein